MPVEYFTDMVNYDSLRITIDNWDELPMPEECKKSWTIKTKNGKTYSVDPLVHLKEYFKEVKVFKNKPYGTRKVSYMPSCSANASGYCGGRQYVKDAMGLQSFSKYIRNTISAEFYHDIDMVNCHPVLFVQLCEKKGWDCSAIEYYNDHREKCLQDIMELMGKNRDDAKRDVIIALYNNGKVGGYVNRLEWFQRYCQNIKDIQEQMYEENEYAVVRQFAVEKNNYKKKEKRNVKGSLCSLIMNEIENSILECCISFLRSKNISVKCLVKSFDGFQIPKKESDMDDVLLREMELFVERMVGWRVKFIRKIPEHFIDLSGFKIRGVESYVSTSAVGEDCKTFQASIDAKGTHYTVGKFIQEYTKGRFMSDGNTIYVFDTRKHIWVSYGDVILREYISSAIAPCYVDRGKMLEIEASGITDDFKHQTEIRSKVEVCNDIASKLQSSGYKDSLLKELRSILFDPDFCNGLDSKKHLIGFTNGVYDMECNEFREGRPEDYISLSTGYDYMESFTEKHLEAKQVIEDFLKSVFPTRKDAEGLEVEGEEYHFLLKRLAYTLYGKKILQDSNLMFLIGSGGNGKGVLKKLCEATFGSYIYTPHSNILSSKRASSGASPDLVKMRGVRLLLCEEPDDGEPISTADIKAWTGGGSIEARNLYSKDIIKFEVQFAIFVLMNNVISIKSLDGGFIRRLDNLQFPYSFVETPLLDHEKQIVCGLDSLFADTLEYRQVFMRMLLDIWKEGNLLVKKIPKPRSVITFTQEYLYNQNSVRRFVDSMLEKVPVMFNDDSFVWVKDENFITSADMKKAYISSEFCNRDIKRPDDWFPQQLKNLSICSMKKTWRRGGCYTSMIYAGWRFKKEEEEDTRSEVD